MATPAQLLPHVDELILEYLLFRGFTKSFQALHAERKRDRTRSFDVEQIITQLLTHVQTYQLEPILDTWKFLEARFFSRLDASYSASVLQLEDSWLRLYVVNAIKTGRREKAVEFFTLLADKLNARAGGQVGNDSWQRWFILPYVQHPENDPYFKTFFTKQWLEAFVTSFRNFLSLVFRSLPLPKLLALQISRLEEPALKMRLHACQSECSRLRLHNAQSADKIRKLEDAGRQLNDIVQTMVQHQFTEHFSAPSSQDTALEESTKLVSSLLDQVRVVADLLRSNQHGEGESVKRQLAESALLDPLQLKLHTGNTESEGDSERQMDVSSAPSSATSLQSGESPGSSPTNLPSGQALLTLSSQHALAQPDLDGSTRLALCRHSSDHSKFIASRFGAHGIDIITDNDKSYHHIDTGSVVTNVEWAATSQTLIYAMEDGTVNLWDADAGKRVFSISYSSDNYKPFYLTCARSAPLGGITLIGSRDPDTTSKLSFFSVADQTIQVLSSIELDGVEDINIVRCSADGSVFAVCDATGRVTLVSPSHSRPLCSWQLAEESSVIDIDITPDGQFIVVLAEGSDIITEWSTRKLVAASNANVALPAPHATYKLPSQPGKLDLPSQQLRRLEVDPSARFIGLCAAFDENELIIFERGRREPIAQNSPKVGSVDAIAWHPEKLEIITLSNASSMLSRWTLSMQ